jgi:hypothetical protein
MTSASAQTRSASSQPPTASQRAAAPGLVVANLQDPQPIRYSTGELSGDGSVIHIEKSESNDSSLCRPCCVVQEESSQTVALCRLEPLRAFQPADSTLTSSANISATSSGRGLQIRTATRPDSSARRLARLRSHAGATTAAQSSLQPDDMGTANVPATGFTNITPRAADRNRELMGTCEGIRERTTGRRVFTMARRSTSSVLSESKSRLEGSHR